MSSSIPAVEVADDARAFRVRRPRRERDPVDAVDRRHLRAEDAIRLAQFPFAEEMKIEVGDDRAEEVWIELVVADAVALPQYAIWTGNAGLGMKREERRRTDALHRAQTVWRLNRRALRFRQKSADLPAAILRMLTENP